MAQTEVGIRLSLSGQNEVTGGLDRVKSGLGGMESAASATLRSVQGLGAALGAAFSVQAFVKAADAVTVLNNQLKLATGSTQAAGRAYEALFDIAQRSRVSFTELGGTFASIARAGDQLGISQQRLLGVTEAISNAVAISGGSAESAQAALVQLSQGLASGTLRGDELNSVMEQTPRLASALAAGLGITTGELRKMGEAGEITADKVIKALESQASVLSGEVKNSVITLGQAWTQMGNSATKAVGTWDAASGASATLASAMQGLAGAIDSVGKFAKEHEAAISYVTNGLAGAATVAGVTALGVGLYSAAGAVASFGAAWLATPLGPIIAGLALVAAGVASVSAAAKTFNQSDVGLSVALSDIDEKINRLQNSGRKLSEAGQANLEKYKAQRESILKQLALSTKDDGSFDGALNRRGEQAKADAAADKANAEAIEKADALVKTKNGILKAGYEEAVKIAQGYQGAIDKAEKSGDTDKQSELVAKRSAMLIASAKETAEAVKSFNEKDTATARESAKERLEIQIAGYERAGQSFDDYQKRQDKSLKTAHDMGLTSEAEYIRAKEQLDLGVNQGKQELVQQELKAVQNSGLLKKDRIAQEQKFTTEIQKLKDQQVQITEDAADAIALAEQKEFRAGLDSNAQTVEAAQARAAQLQDQLRAQQDANKEIGLSTTEVIALRKATAELTAVELERRAGAIQDASPALANSLREQATAIRGIAAANAEALEKSAAIEQFNNVWASVDRTAHDTFVNIFNGGQDAFTKLRDTLKATLLDLLYQMTVRKWVFDITANVVPGASSATAAAVNGVGNALSGNSSLLTGLFSAGGPIASGITNIGAAMINGPLSSVVGDLGASLVANSTAIASAVPYVGAALVAIKALTDYKIEATGNALVANLGGGSTVVANRNDYKQTGGLFGGGTTQNSEWSAASAELTAYMDAQVKLVTESARAYGTALGLPVADLDSFKQQIEVSLTGLNADQAKEAINKAIGGFGDALVSANFGPALDGLKRSGETSSATLVRVATEITTVNSAMGMLGGKLFDVNAAGIKAADGLVQAMGGLEAFQQQTASYYDNYYSDEEKRLRTAQNIQTQLANAGVDVGLEQVLNGTKEDFRALVESFTKDGANLDDAGQKAVAALMAVAGAFATIAKTPLPKVPEVPTESSFGAGVGTSGPSQSGWAGQSGASEAANAILQERKTLQDELDNLTMTSTELLEKQRNALDESNRALFDQIQVAKEAARVAEQNKSLQDEYNQLTMTSAQLRALEREKIAEANLELFDRITALKAEQEAIATANNAVDAALAGVQRAIDAEKKSIEAARQAAQERVGILKSIVDSIGGAVDTLRGNVESTKAQAARQANAFIDNALSNAQLTGYMPDPADLKDAIAKAMAGIDKQGLSQFEYEKQQLILAGKLESLGKIAKPQLSAAEEAVKVAETQLQVLDDIMEEARKQVDELRGIDTSVKSVEAAIAALTAAILASITAQGTSYRPTPNTPLPNVGGIKQQGLTYAEMQAHAVNLSNWNANPIDAGTALYNAAVRYGYTSDDLDRAMGWTAGHSLEWALANGLPAFDVGTNMVPRDMVAKIHEGEAIIPKAYNPAAGGVSGNARLESLVEGLTKEVQRLQAIVNDGNKSNERIAVAVNGNPDRPVPIDVLENSAGLATA
jgi:tape measure domain-containing protein